MQIREFTTLDDPALDDFARLTDVALRRAIEPEGGLYLAESLTVIGRALAAGHRPRSVLTSERWLPELSRLLEGHNVPVYVGAPALLEELTGYHLHRGALASMHRPALPDPAELLRDARRVVVIENVVDHTNVSGRKIQESDRARMPGRSRIAVLENLTDHTNVGAIFRSAAAIGVDAVLVSPQCADPEFFKSSGTKVS